jgi:hypothetical protein
VLAGDLWETAVNLHPRTLSDLRFKDQVQKDKSVPLGMLQKYGFDLRNKMGTFLREIDKVKFTSLKDVRDSFHRAFSAHGERIDETLRSDSLRYLSAVRNVLVHKAGIADKEFCDEVLTMAQLATIKEGQRASLDGQLTLDLVNPAIQASVQLIQAVDDWLVSHPE